MLVLLHLRRHGGGVLILCRVVDLYASLEFWTFLTLQGHHYYYSVSQKLREHLTVKTYAGAMQSDITLKCTLK